MPSVLPGCFWFCAGAAGNRWTHGARIQIQQLCSNFNSINVPWWMPSSAVSCQSTPRSLHGLISCLPAHFDFIPVLLYPSVSVCLSLIQYGFLWAEHNSPHTQAVCCAWKSRPPCQLPHTAGSYMGHRCYMLSVILSPSIFFFSVIWLFYSLTLLWKSLFKTPFCAFTSVVNGVCCSRLTAVFASSCCFFKPKQYCFCCMSLLPTLLNCIFVHYATIM